ncbi:MAG TPA: uracil-DNA glycosylase [Nocardioides sp.]
MLPEAWIEALGEEFDASRLSAVLNAVEDERARGAVYPPANRVFRAFELTTYDQVNVVILGQDPYPGEGQADGLSFSAPNGPKPLSLRNIERALREDLALNLPDGGDLAAWAQQGVLLLNTALTVKAGAANSHAALWQDFTNTVIRALNDRPRGVVFLAWGQAAVRQLRLVTHAHHKIIPAAHPAARVKAEKRMYFAQPFSQANAAGNAPGMDWPSPIVWGRLPRHQ